MWTRVLWIPIWLAVSCGLAAAFALVGLALDWFEDWRQGRADRQFAVTLRRRKADYIARSDR